jgi:hypothetical protein
MKKRKEGPIMSLSPKRASAIVAAMTAVGTTAIAACSSSSNHSQPEISDAAAAVTDATGTVQDEATTPAVGDGASTDGPSSITCGSMTCTAPSGGILPIPLSACCLPDNSCGASLGGALAATGSACLSTATPIADPTCPSQSIMGFSLTGCCAIDGICGDDLSMLGLGCNSASALLGGFGGGGATGDAGAPQPCGGDAGGSSLDAMPSANDAMTTSGD